MYSEQLLINAMEMSQDMQAIALSSSAPVFNVAEQLKDMVANMQEELGDEEIQIEGVIGQGGGGVVYKGSWRGLTVVGGCLWPNFDLALLDLLLSRLLPSLLTLRPNPNPNRL